MLQDELMTRRKLMAAGAAVLSVFGWDGPLSAEGNDDESNPSAHPPIVHIHPDLLTAKDRLTFGPRSKEIPLKSPTLLLWIDLRPRARFAHPTQIVLISAEGARVEKGDWWPTLNGQDLFREDMIRKVSSPMVLSE
jgi:hypothetical protein